MMARWWLGIVGTAVVGATGCSTLYGLDKYSTADASSEADLATLSDASDNDSAAFGDGSNTAPADAGVDGCPQGGCASAVCVPFDNTARIRGFVADSGLPPLPDAGPATTTSAPDGGADAGADSGTGASLPPCSSLPSPVYVVGSTGLQAVAAELGQLTAHIPITLVFAAAKSCDGPKAIVLNESALDLGVTTATYWDDTGTASTCLIDDASKYADIGLGQLFADACLTLPQGTTGVGDFLGPVTPFDMVVPTSSMQTVISAEALYYTVGLGNGAVSPWTDPNFVFFNQGSGPQFDTSMAIGVPAAQWIGTKVTSAPQNVAKVGNSPQPQSTLGMIGTELVESPSNTSTIKAIAYEEMGQSCGYYANATATSADKQNVRDGHYPLWGFAHMFTKVNLQNVPLSANAGALINFFTGNQPTPTGDFLKFIINDHLVPLCAMRVTRQSEMGRLLPFTPSPSCGCYFDSLTKGSSTCPVCSVDANCSPSAPHCNLGFCEAN